MSKGKIKTNKLHGVAQFALFVSSYLPLLILIIAKQVSENYKFLNWSGFTVLGLKIFLLKFGLSSILFFISLIGVIGIKRTFGNIEEVAQNGFPVKLKDVSNKNSESIGYIATYLIPFLFQSFNGFYECASVLFLLVIIYRIYINSSLLLINPILSIKYAIYEIEYEKGNQSKKGLVISKDKYLDDDASVKLYEIGHKLFFAINLNDHDTK